jgi:uncharacterized membrane protein
VFGEGVLANLQSYFSGEEMDGLLWLILGIVGVIAVFVGMARLIKQSQNRNWRNAEGSNNPPPYV